MRFFLIAAFALIGAASASTVRYGPTSEQCTHKFTNRRLAPFRCAMPAGWKFGSLRVGTVQRKLCPKQNPWPNFMLTYNVPSKHLTRPKESAPKLSLVQEWGVWNDTWLGCRSHYCLSSGQLGIWETSCFAFVFGTSLNFYGPKLSGNLHLMRLPCHSLASSNPSIYRFLCYLYVWE